MSPIVNKLLYDLKCPAISFVFAEMTPFGAVKPLKGIIFNPECNIKTINTASTYRSCSSVSRFSMTFIEGLQLLLDMATVDKTESSK